MKMETTINAEVDGRVKSILVRPALPVQTGDLMIVLESASEPKSA